jgi:hypothetical protein
MLQQYHIPLEWKQLSNILEEADIRNELHKLSINPNNLPNTDFINEVLTELEASNQSLPYNIGFHLIQLFEHDQYILLEPTYHFNRYRLLTLRSDFYQDHTFNFDLIKFKTFCRTKQEESIKSGLRQDLWSHELGENIFGRAEEPGYFGGKGSSGWKFIALSNFLLDVFVASKKMKLFRVAPYEHIMVEGKLFTIHNLLNSSDENYKRAVQQYFIRRLGVSLS